MMVHCARVWLASVQQEVFRPMHLECQLTGCMMVHCARVRLASVQQEECSDTFGAHCLPLAQYIACVANQHFVMHWVCLYNFLFIFAVQNSTLLFTLCSVSWQ